MVADFSLKCDLFGLPFRFANLDTARLYVLYWTSLLLIEILIHEMTTSIMILESRSEKLSGYFLPSSEQFIMAEHYADEICRAIPYCLQEGMGAWGAHIVVASMNHVTKPFAALRREAKFFWCQEIFQVISSRGMNLAVALGNLSLGLWKSYENQSPRSPFEMPLRDAVGPSQVQHVFIEERVADVTDVDNIEPTFEADDANLV
ncbi:uncharacterized protein N7483_009192 [Penicillium malachiteum]|uniref:uncharacterized protein n=1 Tax=Penicillium malachiteum TaxID=1324776 RepID=UPI002547A719|nr:uncharacterized protein N7483_009192 [Penicillium malachiteum]KAJ5721258.1 hypothetical protein N7483_009192 [Penicillium malachiteum]